MELKLRVNSLIDFISEYGVGNQADAARRNKGPDDLGFVFHILKDGFYIKKASPVTPGGTINFLLDERTQISNIEVETTTQFVVKEYDDYSYFAAPVVEVKG